MLYEVVIENIGTVDLADLSLVDDLQTQFGASVFQNVSSLTMTANPSDALSSVTLDTAGWDGTSATNMIDQTVTTNILKIGDSFTVQFTVEVDAAAASGVLDNTATAVGSAVDSNGNPYQDAGGNAITITDDSDSGSDPSTTNSGEPGDTGGSDDPTPLYIPNIGLAKSAGDAVANGDNWDVTFTLNWENTGTVALTNLQVFDDLASQFGGQFSGVTGLAIQNFTGTGTAPSINTSWLTTTSLSLITGGTAEVNDSFEIVFTVTLDPDVTGTSGSGLTNQATSTGDALDENGNPLGVQANDTSDNGTSTTTENGSEDTTDGVFANDPTPIVIADIAVAKSVSAAPTLLANGNYNLTYELVIENIGNVDLADLTVVENLNAHFGSALVSAGSLSMSSAPSGSSSITLNTGWNGNGTTEMIDQAVTTNLLAAGDSFSVQFVVEVDPDAVGAPGALNNQVTAGGNAVDSLGNAINDSTGNPITATDDSDSGSDPNGTNAGEDGDTGGSDDPTPLNIAAIGLAKQANDAVTNGDNWDVTFTFFYENTGTVDLDTLSLVDNVAAEFGNAFVSASGLAVQNFSGTGTAPGVNGGWATDTSLNILDGTGQLNVGDSFEVTFTVTIDPDGIDSTSQSLENQGIASGAAVGDATLTTTDDSDNGTDVHGENGEDDADGTFGNDPTPIVIADVSAAKEVLNTPTLLANGNYEVTYRLVVENVGTVDLANLSLEENLSSQFGLAYVNAYGLSMVTPPSAASNVTLDTVNWNGQGGIEMVDLSAPSLLAVGDSFVVEFIVEVDTVQASGVLENTVTVEGAAVDASGQPINDSTGNPITASDDSDSGSDASTTNTGEPGDTGGSDDPTPLYIPSIGLAKSAGDAVFNGDNWDVTFTLTWENTGTAALNNLQIFDAISAQFGSQLVGVTGLSIQNFSGTGTAPSINAGWLTDSTLSLVTGGTAEVDDSFEVVFTVTLDPDVTGTSSSGLTNQATSTADGLDADGNPLGVQAADTSDNGTSTTTEK